MISATVEELYSGAWVADTVDVVAPTGAFTLDNGTSWSGAVFSQSQDGGRFYSRIVGGKGKLAQTLLDKWYNGTSLIDQIAGDAISEAGESLGASSLGVRVDAWQRKAGTLGQALSQIVAIVGGVWWVDRAGLVQLATTRATGEIRAETVSKAKTDVDGSVLFDTFPSTPAFTPGWTWEGRQIRHIRWVQTPSNFQCAIAFSDLESPPLTWDYFRSYSAKVDKQNSDGTLDVIVDGKFAVTNTKWLAGLPGKIVINGGDEVELGWAGGDPRYPVAWGLKMSSDGKAAARVDDTVDCGTLVIPTTLVGVIGPVAFQIQYVPPGPTHAADVAAAMLAMVAFAPVSVDLAGVITSGQVRVLL